MPLKALQVSGIPTLHDLHEISSLVKPLNFSIIGHRGNGMNSSSSSNSFKENSILSFNNAANFPIQFVEFDVQVTRDNHPIIFHDIFIVAEEEEQQRCEKRVTELSLREFLAYNNKPLLRKTHDGEIVDWIVQNDDSLCTLEDAFLKVEPRVGFNIELKFDDDVVYRDEELACALGTILQCVMENGGGRAVLFSTFQPDAARIVRRMQSSYPVFFLTDGGTEIYKDARRNSLEEAVKLCRECGLDGIVSEVRALLREPEVIMEVKENGLGIMSYGESNNVGEVVYLQCMMGVDGVIVDRVGEISQFLEGFLSRGEMCGVQEFGLVQTVPKYEKLQMGTV